MSDQRNEDFQRAADQYQKQARDVCSVAVAQAQAEERRNTQSALGQAADVASRAQARLSEADQRANARQQQLQGLADKALADQQQQAIAEIQRVKSAAE